MEKCPYCNSYSIYKLGFGGGYKCNNCNKGFDYPDYDDSDAYLGCFAFIIIFTILLALTINACVNC